MTDIEQRLIRAAEEANRLIADCWRRRDCPRCRAPRGEQCRAMPIGYHGMDRCGRIVKPHRERWGVPAR